MDIKQQIILLNIPADLFQHIYLIGPLTKKKQPLARASLTGKNFLLQRKTGGVKNMFVEMAEDKFKDSATYIQKMYA
jgi:hypothetical protein